MQNLGAGKQAQKGLQPPVNCANDVAWAELDNM